MVKTDVYKQMRRIKDYAKENNIPIMVDDGIDFLTTFVIKNQIENVLEIGTAIGYSAIMMALCNPKLKVTSIERDEKRYMEAVKNVKSLELEDRVTLIYNDALNVKIDGTYDLIFIDAAKSQSIHFFEKYKVNLNDKGFIITDNMKFHGYVDKPLEDIKSRNLRGLIRKIKEYRKFLEENKEYKTLFYDNIGDGIAVTSKNE